MIVRHLHNVHELLGVLAQPTAEMRRLREERSEHGQFPARRTWERRLKALPETLAAQIGCLGRHLLDLIQPWATCGRAVAIDSTVLLSRGGVWHQKHREKGEVPHTSIDTQADFPKSGWQCSRLWLEVACRFSGRGGLVSHRRCPDSRQYRRESACSCPVARSAGRCALRAGDRHYDTPDLHEICEQADRLLVTTRYGRYPHTDDGVEVRRVFHKLRSRAMENFNEHFKGIFDGHGQVPTKGLISTQRFALGAIFVYQLALTSPL